MRLLWEDRAWEDYLCWQTQDRKMLKRVTHSSKTFPEAPLRVLGAGAVEA